MRISDWSSDVCSSDLVFLRFVSDNRVPAPEVDRFVGIVEKHIVALNELARERLVAAIIEAMANTLDHAHPNPTQLGTMRNRWWMSSRVNLADNEVTIVLFDQGVGIPNTLDTTAYESLRAALRSEERRVGKECVSTCRSGWATYH